MHFFHNEITNLKFVSILFLSYNLRFRLISKTASKKYTIRNFLHCLKGKKKQYIYERKKHTSFNKIQETKKVLKIYCRVVYFQL